ncbi:MAG: hypothetical protein ABSF25_01725 [Bryobacteraceae bacterium]|jgi:Flp pilus assembly pilin Flp
MMLSRVRTLWRSLCSDETAQGLAEYCLVTALLALVALGIFIHVSGGLQNVWGTAGSAMATAGSTAGDATDSAPGSH